MSTVLVLKCAALGFALAIAATVGVLAGPVSAGLALVTFLLGVATNELFQMRLSPVEAGEHADGDSAFNALLEAGASATPPALQPRAMPKRNFRMTSDELAIGSGLFRTELTARHRRHEPGAEPERRPRWPRATPAEPVQALAPPATPTFEPEPAVGCEPLAAGTRSFRASYVERVG